MMSLVLRIILVCSLLLGYEATQSKPTNPKHYNIVLFGATGDLAQKYLWRGLFSLFKKENEKGKVHFTIYGVARTNQSDGRKAIGDILLKVVQCYDDECRRLKTEFVQTVQYHALTNVADYKALSAKIAENTLSIYGLEQNQTSYESGRLFYMSIPPAVITKTVKRIRQYLLPKAGHPWVRIVLEKPFGKDKESARTLSTKLSEIFADDQIYRVDHYLGKPVVRLILPFRYINREEYEPLWNKHHIERVEVVMKEKLDCSGRLGFYDDVGVVRDVMQNHLTEIMLLVAMEMPSNSGNITEILEKKLAVMKQVRPIHKQGVLFGQYADYKASVINELEKPDYDSVTPSFSAALLHIDNTRWQGVPFVLMSGKQLDEKSSYVRVVFKDNAFCVGAKDGCAKKKQVVFHIASGAPHQPPLILTSPGLPKPKSSQIWQQEKLKMDVSVFGEAFDGMHKLLPSDTEDAYAALLIGVFNGQRHLFTTSDILMASWDVWTPVVQKTLKDSDLQIYNVNKSLSSLNFRIAGQSLEYEMKIQSEKTTDDLSKDSLSDSKHILGHPLISGSVDEIISKLANDIITAANGAVKEKGVFHLALSGGNSPLLLFNYLSQLSDTDVNLPWRHTHVWQVDERCVSSDSVHSNFAALNSYLLRHVQIPYHHIHPIPVHLRDEPCQQGSEVAEFYETAIKRNIPSGAFDFILLGLGSDGHTASLFPRKPSLEVKDKMTVFIDDGPFGAIPHRVSLTFKAINQAKQVGVLVTGKSKRDIMKGLENSDSNNVNDFPILGVQSVSNGITFYIDHLALGHN